MGGEVAKAGNVAGRRALGKPDATQKAGRRKTSRLGVAK